MTPWIVTFHPEPRLGGNPKTTVARLLACTDAGEPPAFELTLAAAMSLGLLGDVLAAGLTSTADRAWPNDSLRSLIETPPDWTSEGLKVWRLPAEATGSI